MEILEVVSAQAKLRDPQIDRAITAELRFPGGHTGRGRCSMWSLHVLQVSARVVGDWASPARADPVTPQFFHRALGPIRRRQTGGAILTPCVLRLQLDAFAAAVLRGEPVKTTPEDAVENMTVIDAIYCAAGLRLASPAERTKQNVSDGVPTRYRVNPGQFPGRPVSYLTVRELYARPLAGTTTGH